MCLEINIYRHKRGFVSIGKNPFFGKLSYLPLVAKKDIPVYKILIVRKDLPRYITGRKKPKKTKFLSPYYTMGWKMGFIYYQTGKDKIRASIYGTPAIDKGLHSFRSLKTANRENNWDAANTIFKFIIPKGTEYFLGTNSDIVSNQLYFPTQEIPKPMKLKKINYEQHS